MIDRRRFLASAAAISSAAISSACGMCENSIAADTDTATTAGRVQRVAGDRVKLGLNAFTFNHELLSGRMTMEDVIDFCAEHGVDGVDMTGYYFPGYPAVCDDETIFRLKRYAFINGVTISGTGVRNSFTTDDQDKLAADVQHAKEWIQVAAKLGSDVLRVFSGKQMGDGPERQAAQQRLIESLQHCVSYAEKHGVIVALQHHHDFLKTAQETMEVVQAVDSPWCGVVLDIGSLRVKNVYDEIERLLPFTTTWQIKEQVWIDGRQVPADLDRIADVIQRVGYRGFLPIEVLGKAKDVDARKKHAAAFLEQVRKRMMG